ncbi:hypothetical protein CYMTET_16626 [Cymbomonas tetramitiformis]|uniref:Uncharacterized protein n=1 Tax=Cymbomonas tetramitiformis TaxID=36881 RepID=A0AAE0GBZ1_9CHLO|nr:hypothetical protein CYMTET_16626 [Cymbomonas tetramitiformis]
MLNKLRKSFKSQPSKSNVEQKGASENAKPQYEKKPAESASVNSGDTPEEEVAALSAPESTPSSGIPDSSGYGASLADRPATLQSPCYFDPEVGPLQVEGEPEESGSELDDASSASSFGHDAGRDGQESGNALEGVPVSPLFAARRPSEGIDSGRWEQGGALEGAPVSPLFAARGTSMIVTSTVESTESPHRWMSSTNFRPGGEAEKDSLLSPDPDDAKLSQERESDAPPSQPAFRRPLVIRRGADQLEDQLLSVTQQWEKTQLDLQTAHQERHLLQSEVQQLHGDLEELQDEVSRLRTTSKPGSAMTALAKQESLETPRGDSDDDSSHAHGPYTAALPLSPVQLSPPPSASPGWHRREARGEKSAAPCEMYPEGAVVSFDSRTTAQGRAEGGAGGLEELDDAGALQELANAEATAESPEHKGSPRMLVEIRLKVPLPGDEAKGIDAEPLEADAVWEHQERVEAGSSLEGEVVEVERSTRAGDLKEELEEGSLAGRYVAMLEDRLSSDKEKHEAEYEELARRLEEATAELAHCRGQLQSHDNGTVEALGQHRSAVASLEMELQEQTTLVEKLKREAALDAEALLQQHDTVLESLMERFKDASSASLILENAHHAQQKRNAQLQEALSDSRDEVCARTATERYAVAQQRVLQQQVELLEAACETAGVLPPGIRGASGGSNGGHTSSPKLEAPKGPRGTPSRRAQREGWESSLVKTRLALSTPGSAGEGFSTPGVAGGAMMARGGSASPESAEGDKSALGSAYHTPSKRLDLGSIEKGSPSRSPGSPGTVQGVDGAASVKKRLFEQLSAVRQEEAQGGKRLLGMEDICWLNGNDESSVLMRNEARALYAEGKLYAEGELYSYDAGDVPAAAQEERKRRRHVERELLEARAANDVMEARLKMKMAQEKRERSRSTAAPSVSAELSLLEPGLSVQAAAELVEDKALMFGEEDAEGSVSKAKRTPQKRIMRPPPWECTGSSSKSMSRSPTRKSRDTMTTRRRSDSVKDRRMRSSGGGGGSVVPGDKRRSHNEERTRQDGVALSTHEADRIELLLHPCNSTHTEPTREKMQQLVRLCLRFRAEAMKARTESKGKKPPSRQTRPHRTSDKVTSTDDLGPAPSPYSPSTSSAVGSDRSPQPVLEEMCSGLASELTRSEAEKEAADARASLAEARLEELQGKMTLLQEETAAARALAEEVTEEKYKEEAKRGHAERQMHYYEVQVAQLSEQLHYQRARAVAMERILSETVAAHAATRPNQALSNMQSIRQGNNISNPQAVAAQLRAHEQAGWRAVQGAPAPPSTTLNAAPDEPSSIAAAVPSFEVDNVATS